MNILSKQRRGKNVVVRKMLLLFCVIFFSVKTTAQSFAGITNVRDTSYSTNSAFSSTKKDHPDIKIVHEFKPDGVAEKREVTYNAIVKRKLKLDVFYPKNKNNQLRTAIVIIHGGGWRSGSRSQHYPLAQKLAELGYVCFTPEYRLSTEALFPAAIYDAKAAIRWVRKNAAAYNIDTAHIVAMGFSAGGELASFLGTTGNMPLFEGTVGNTDMSSQVNAIIDIDGTLSFVHPESGEGDESKHPSAGSYWFGYTKKENRMLWETASPLSYTDSKTPPTLFLNSAVARMHAGREDYIKILNQYNIYSEVHTFEDAPHSFCLFDPWFQPTVNYIDGFLKKVFK